MVSDLLQDPANLVWLDLEDPSGDELGTLKTEFDFHEKAFEDVLHRDQRAKLDPYEGFNFLAIRPLRKEGERLEEQEVHVFLGANYLITIRYPPVFDLTAVLDRVEQKPVLAKEGPSGILYMLLDEIADDYFEIAEWLEDVSDDLEDLVFGEGAAEDVHERVFKMKKQLVKLRRNVSPLRVVLDRLQELPDVLVSDALQPYYRDVEDHLIRTAEFADNVRELLTTALEANLSQVSNRLNVVMKELTAWASIILAPTLIAGIYGMNFRHMPELSWLFGYPFALGLMAVVAGVLWRTFRRRGWLGTRKGGAR